MEDDELIDLIDKYNSVVDLAIYQLEKSKLNMPITIGRIELSKSLMINGCKKAKSSHSLRANVYNRYTILLKEMYD
jgi:hypothetical protein